MTWNLVEPTNHQRSLEQSYWETHLPDAHRWLFSSSSSVPPQRPSPAPTKMGWNAWDPRECRTFGRWPLVKPNCSACSGILPWIWICTWKSKSTLLSIVPEYQTIKRVKGMLTGDHNSHYLVRPSNIYCRRSLPTIISIVLHHWINNSSSQTDARSSIHFSILEMRERDPVV